MVWEEERGHLQLAFKFVIVEKCKSSAAGQTEGEGPEHMCTSSVPFSTLKYTEARPLSLGSSFPSKPMLTTLVPLDISPGEV